MKLKLKTSEKLLIGALALISVFQLSVNLLAKKEFVEAQNISTDIQNDTDSNTVRSSKIVIKIN
ncbi:MAG: hypothetical protein JXR27_07315 [Paludibacteraceae bacterium]|nr:hypothetical protein [Paludibacteraceae bacterium]